MRPPLFTRLVLAAGAAALLAACVASAADGAAAPASAVVGRAAVAVRDVTIPSGTILQLTLSTRVASDTSHVEDAIAAELKNAVMVGGRTALPSGALVAGVVRSVDASVRVKRRAHLVLDFTSVTSGGRRYAMSAEGFSRQAAVPREDGVTLATEGEQVSFPIGTDISIQLAVPLIVRVSE